MAKFKVGDKVRVVKRDYQKSPNWVDQMDEYIGNEYTILRFTGDNYIIFKEDISWKWHEDWLDPVEKKFVPKFKIGDVLIPKSPSVCGTFQNAKGYRIRVTGFTGYDKKPYQYEILDSKMQNVESCFNCFTDDDLDLAPVEKFKPGDKVIIVRKGMKWNESGKMNHWFGKKVTLLEKRSDWLPNMWWIKEDEGENPFDSGRHWYWEESCFEPASSAKPFTQEDHPHRVKFKIGDRVIGLPSASKEYGITREGWEGIVIKIEGEEIGVEKKIGMVPFMVDPKHFRLADPSHSDIWSKSFTESVKMDEEMIDHMKHAIMYGMSVYRPDTIIHDEYSSIKKKKTFMSKLNTMMKKLLDADTKVLVEAGFLDSELNLTRDAAYQLDLIAFDKFKTELVAAAKERIEEAKKEKDGE